MVRSSGIPRRRALDTMSGIIGARARTVEFKRPTVSTGPLDERTETVNAHTEHVYPHDPSESIANEEGGERVVGDLAALAVADGTVDVQVNDRITYGGVEYEVDTVVGYPEDDDADGTESPDTDYWKLTFVRRQ